MKIELVFVPAHVLVGVPAAVLCGDITWVIAVNSRLVAAQGRDALRAAELALRPILLRSRNVPMTGSWATVRLLRTAHPLPKDLLTMLPGGFGLIVPDFITDDLALCLGALWTRLLCWHFPLRAPGIRSTGIPSPAIPHERDSSM